MLEGLRVLELAAVLAGPSVGQWMAEQGADVIKVENPRTGGDVTRSWRFQGEPADGVSSYFASCNFGKRSLALDLSRPQGTKVLNRLLNASDIVLSSFAPGKAEALGADASTLRKNRPALIVGEIRGYRGTDSRTGYDAVIQAETGWMHLNGPPDAHPTKIPVALVDVLAAHQLKEGLLLALLNRERTGQGSVIRVSLEDAARAALVNQATNWLHGGMDPARMGSEHPNIAPYGTVFSDADGLPVVLAVGTDRQFTSLCQVLGAPELARDARFRSNSLRVEHRSGLRERLGRLIASEEREPLLARLAEAGVPAGAVNRISESFSKPSAAYLKLEDDGIRGLRHSIAEWAPPRPPPPLARPPVLGGHSREILASVAGMRADEIERLITEGIVYL